MLSHEIEIAASPEEVRKVFLDFSAFSEWHHGYFESVELPEGKATGESCVAGDNLKCSFGGTKLVVEITETTPAKLAWRGGAPIPGMLSGLHTFHFTPSAKTPGHTTFSQDEEFSGLFSPLMRFGFMENKLMPNFVTFDEDLKRRVEGGVKQDGE